MEEVRFRSPSVDEVHSTEVGVELGRLEGERDVTSGERSFFTEAQRTWCILYPLLDAISSLFRALQR